MKELVPIKVKIGLRSNGYADHPNWNQLPLAETSNPDEHIHGGWKYDKKYGHKEVGPDSPYGMQWGLLLVTPQFAQEAVVTFPALITVITELEAQTFYEERSTAHLEEEVVDSKVIQDLKNIFIMAKEVGASQVKLNALKARIIKATNPDDSEPGITRNKIKSWIAIKDRLGVNIVGL